MERKKINSLESLPVTSSGLEELNHDFKRDLDYQNHLKQFLNKEYDSLDKFFQERPDLIDSIKTKALFLLNLIATKQKIKAFHISVSGFKPKLADDTAFALIELIKDLGDDFAFDFYELKSLMPTIVIYYSDYLLKEKFYRTKDLNLLEKVRGIIEDDLCFEELVDENLVSQKYRLRALYHRRLANDDKVEENILLYRTHFQVDISKKVSLTKLQAEKLPHWDPLPAGKFFAEIYQQAASIQKEVLIRSGIYEDTCFYYQCTDCCKKDFPAVSLAEFLYIKDNLTEEHLIELKAKAELIQAAHEKQYGTRLVIVDQALPGKQKENPNNFLFVCPSLDNDDKCTIYETRPLACRSFGLSTIDGESVQACKYYLTQYRYNSSHRNEQDVYDSEPHTKMIGEINEKLAETHGFGHMKQPVGTLVAWLS